MSCPFRHREVSSSDILNMSMTDCCVIERKVNDDLEVFER